MEKIEIGPILIIIGALIALGILVVGIIVASGPVKTLPASIVCVEGPDAKKRVSFGRKACIRIGRDSSSDFVINHQGVSNKHAQVVHRVGEFWLEDVGSRNGVHVGDRRIQNESVRLSDGMRFTIGPDVFRLMVSDDVPAQPPQPPPPPPPPRAVQPPLAELYDLHRPPLASGGQATVYRATQRSSGRVVVVKCLNQSLRGDHAKYMRTKFEQQIVIGRTLRHPNLAEIIGGDAYGTNQPPYLVEEYLSGGTLFARIKQRRFDEIEGKILLGKLCAVLAYLHDRKILHRDITPENVMFTADGTVKLIDLGIARFTGMPSQTAEGMSLLMGKMGYLAPELLSAPASVQTDIYSLGVIAFEMFTGRLPFPDSEVKSPNWLVNLISKEAPRLRSVGANVSAEMEHIVMHALANNPKQRFRSAREMAAALGVQIQPPPEPSKIETPLVLRNRNTGRMVTITDAGPIQRLMLDPGDLSISRKQHGELQFQSGAWLIGETQDAPSANGLYVNEIRVLAGDWVMLNAGDVIRFGKSQWTCLLQGVE